MSCIKIDQEKLVLIFILSVLKQKLKKIFIFNQDKNSEGAKYCLKNLIILQGIGGVIKNLKDTKIIFDATSAKSNILILKKLRKLINNKYFINLTPSINGEYVIPYINTNKIPQITNLITCGGQTSIPIINEVKNILGQKLKYVELVSNIAAKSAGKATRDNIDEYITNTERAIRKITKVNKIKVMININPAEPPVNMMNSLFFELTKDISKKDLKKIENSISKINNRIKIYMPKYNASIFETIEKKILMISI